MSKIGYIATSGDTFVKPIMAHLAQRYEVENLVVPREDGSANIRWPREDLDLVWLDWCDDSAVSITNNLKACPTIIRLHSFEALGPWPGQVEWRRVDRLIFVADHVRRLAITRWPQIAEVDHVVIPNGLDFEKFVIPEGKTLSKRIAWVGGINAKKGPQLLFAASRAIQDFDPAYTIEVAGEWQDLRFKAYLESMDLENLRFHGHVPHEEMPAWLADKGFILSTSPWESFQYAVAEGIACGCVPLIHAWPGAEEVYEHVQPWATTTELIERIEAFAEWPRETGRLCLKKRHDLPDRLADIDALVDDTLDSFAWPTVSACMIAKGDETTRLRESLMSFHQDVDEIILNVDTRSGTAAADVGREFGATVLTEGIPLYRDDEIHFAGTRNAAEQAASGDWAFIIDCDEIVEGSANLRRLAWEAQTTGHDTVAVQVNCMVNSGLAEEGMDVRMHRRGEGIHYRYPRHNQLTGFTKTMGGRILEIRSSYEGRGALEHRCERTNPGLELMWEHADEECATPEEAEEQRCHAAFFLCRMHAAQCKYDEVIRWGEECKKILGPESGKSPWWTWYANALLLTEGREPAMAAIEDGLAQFPNHADLMHLKLAVIALDWGMALKASENGVGRLVPMHSRQHLDKLGQVVELLKLPIKVEGLL